MAGSGRFAALREKSRRGFRGYPVATVAYYGPDASRASKVAVGVILAEGDEPYARLSAGIPRSPTLGLTRRSAGPPLTLWQPIR